MTQFLMKIVYHIICHTIILSYLRSIYKYLFFSLLYILKKHRWRGWFSHFSPVTTKWPVFFIYIFSTCFMSWIHFIILPQLLLFEWKILGGKTKTNEKQDSQNDVGSLTSFRKQMTIGDIVVLYFFCFL